MGISSYKIRPFRVRIFRAASFTVGRGFKAMVNVPYSCLLITCNHWTQISEKTVYTSPAILIQFRNACLYIYFWNMVLDSFMKWCTGCQCFFINIDRWRVASFRHLSWTSCRQKPISRPTSRPSCLMVSPLLRTLAMCFFESPGIWFTGENPDSSIVSPASCHQPAVAAGHHHPYRASFFWSSFRIHPMHYFRHSMHGALPLYSPKQLPCFVGTAIME